MIYYFSVCCALTAGILFLLLVLAKAPHSAAFSWQVNWDWNFQKDLIHTSVIWYYHLEYLVPFHEVSLQPEV